MNIANIVRLFFLLSFVSILLFSGYYYVADSTYINMKGFLKLYRGEQYYLRDYRGLGWALRGPQKLFNYRHSSLHNVIEHWFGVLKAQFLILRNVHNYI